MSIYPRELDTRPLTTWLGELTPAAERRKAKFTAPLSNTLTVLETELRALRAQHPVMELAIPANKFGVQGRPYANAIAEHPGVVLSLPTTKVGPLRYATDTFATWQDNLRAIALGMKALRQVESYGIASRGEQYTGFRQLPQSGGTTPQEDAARVILGLAQEPITEASVARCVADPKPYYRRAAKLVHSDRNPSGETDAIWLELDAAMQVMRGAASERNR